MSDPGAAAAPPPGASEDERSGPSPAELIVGGLLILVGTGWLVETLDLFDFPWAAVLPAALIVVGAVLVLGRHAGTPGGLIAVGVALTLVLAVGHTVAGVLDVPIRGGIGERTIRPAAATQIGEDYRLAVGDLEIDLRATELPEGVTRVVASVAVGQLVVRVPEDAAVDVEARAAVGRIVLFGDASDGINLDAEASVPGSTGRRLDLQVEIGLGQLEVRR